MADRIARELLKVERAQYQTAECPRIGHRRSGAGRRPDPAFGRKQGFRVISASLVGFQS